ncbi:MAG: AAA family ATPase, partial [Kiritimatiellae bacterium]|nr:AAA family ATPase [Kiritimatiellia bacterium]
ADQDLPSGARFLLEKGGSHRIDFSCVLGTLASHVDVEPDYRTAFEATLRAWLDAVVISDTENALHVLRILDKERAGAARILVAEVSAPAGYSSNCGEGEPLASHVRCTDRLAPFLQRLLSGVRVVDSLDNIPCQIPQGVTYVTRSGCVVRPGGEMEFWMRPQQPDNPFSRKHLVEYTREELESIRSRILETENKIKGMLTLDQALDETLRDAEARAIEARRALAQGEGANQVLVREVALVRERLETVTWELASLENQDGTTGDKRRQIEENLQVLRSQREQLAAALAEENRRLREFETEQDKITAEVTEHRIRVNSLGEKLGHLRAQYETGEKRLHELRLTVESRSAGLLSYQEGIRKLTEEIRSAEQQLSTLEAEVLANQEKAEALRKNREKQIEELRAMEHGLTAKRQELEALRTRKTGAEVARAECLMRRQNQIDRLTSEYGITLETALQEPDPEYEGTTPSLETAETVVAEIKAKIEAMGPVNLVAIQEYKELEERHRFLTEQEQDLVRSKHQLMEMIRRINRTTTEMFSTTFAKINENFQTMFQKFFDGGQAKLVLVNEEDVLECGIEIIARPPGKRLTNISLLSGGERTLTAVALLFAIYMIKPSPFCMLDELDAALDETNIMRFVRLLQEFRQQSQFVVITHNRQTIAEADVLYGVTMEEKGVSKIVSMRFSDYETGSPPPGRAATPAVQDGR